MCFKIIFNLRKNCRWSFPVHISISQGVNSEHSEKNCSEKNCSSHSEKWTMSAAWCGALSSPSFTPWKLGLHFYSTLVFLSCTRQQPPFGGYSSTECLEPENGASEAANILALQQPSRAHIVCHGDDTNFHATHL